MFWTALQLVGLVLVILSAALLAGVPGAVGAVGLAFVYLGLAGEG
jgi:hypothetical protein